VVIDNKDIKVIFFDIGGVLLDIHPDKMFNCISSITDVSFEKVKSSFPEEGHDIYEKGQMTNQEWFQTFKIALSNNSYLTENKFWDAWAMILGKETKVIDILSDLKKYYKVWLLSNTNPKHISDELDSKYVFPHLVDGAIYSYNVGLRKPNKEIYLKACELAEVKPKESVFIDDLSENIYGAKKVGLNGIHYKSIEILKDDLKLLGIIK
jgi:HAD superfamily hydrolase (TIGR01509 family)|tara:strand:+ start:7158 stop:7784 length:627 start_codon:yes stop_codon:yes gene_type:complete